MSKHTKGPWSVCLTIQSGVVTHWHITGPKYGSIYPVCNHTMEVMPNVDEQRANARLIAAAPDLLDALKRMVLEQEREGFGDELPDIKQAKEAIAKAEWMES